MTMYVAIHSVVQRGRHSWRMAWCVVGDDGRRGRRNYTTLTGCTGQRDANRRAKEVRAEIEATMAERGGSVGGEEVTVWEWALDFWDAKRQNGDIIRNTYDGYVGILRGFPDLAKKEFAELSIADVERACERCKRKPDLGRTTVRNRLSIMRTMLHAAYREGMTMEDFGEYISLPKWRGTRPRALTSAERGALLELIRRVVPPLRTAVMMGLSCGLRIGEVCALRWGDFDESVRKVHISRAIESGNEHRNVRVKEPKSEAGFRTIPYSTGAASALSELREIQTKRYEGAGVRINDDSYVFSNPDGMPLHPRRIQAMFREACDSVGLEVQFHWLRHTFATELIANGVDVKTVSTLLGHARPSTTLDIYTSVTKDSLERASDIIERLGGDGDEEAGWMRT